MKLHDIAIGTRFEYEGKVFVKTGPLTAASDEGGQRIIPRYAVLKPLDLQNAEGPAGSRGKLDKKTVLAAFDHFYQRCSPLVNAASQPELESARQRFIAALK